MQISVLASLVALLPSSTFAGDFWTVNCAPLTSQRSDPIVSPPGEAAAHVHAVAGGTAFSRNMQGINAAVNAKATTCDKFTDHSNYVSSSADLLFPRSDKSRGRLLTYQ
jgi:hypothetical protein